MNYFKKRLHDVLVIKKSAYNFVSMYSYIFIYIPIHDICMKIGPQRSLALPVFHALTGCDQIASFYDHGKRSAWKVWEKNDDLTECFNIIGSPDVTQSTVNHSMKAVERFVCQLFICKLLLFVVNAT